MAIDSSTEAQSQPHYGGCPPAPAYRASLFQDMLRRLVRDPLVVVCVLYLAC